MSRPRTVDKWKLDKKSQKIVSKELSKWIKLFTKHADGRKGNVRKLDYLNDDIAFYTDCKDLLKDDPESTAYERNKKVWKRKKNVGNSLLLRHILNDKKSKVNILRCTHCGSDDYFFEGSANGTFELCRNCNRVIIDSYFPGFLSDVEQVIRFIWRKMKDEPS